MHQPRAQVILHSIPGHCRITISPYNQLHKYVQAVLQVKVHNGLNVQLSAVSVV